MTLIPESLHIHFVRWAKMEYDCVPDLGLDVIILLYEQESSSFEELKSAISNRDADWLESWEAYRKYNKI